MRTCPPVAIAGQPSACAGVGASNARSNHVRVDGEKTSERAHALRVPPSPYPAARALRRRRRGWRNGGVRPRVAPEREARPERLPARGRPRLRRHSSEGRWPPEILDARTIAPDAPLGSRSRRRTDARRAGPRRLVRRERVHGRCRERPADYDEWGSGWTYESLEPFLERARATLRPAPANTDDPSPFHLAFVEAAQALGFPLLDDLNDHDRPVGAAPYPANVVDGTRWNAALAYLDPCRARPNLTVLPDTLVDRVVLRAGRAVGVVDAEETAPRGRRGRARGRCVLLPGDPPALAGSARRRSSRGSGSRCGRPPRRRSPARPLRHQRRVGAVPATCEEDTERRAARRATLFEPHALLKAASSGCPPGAWDLHLAAVDHRGERRRRVRGERASSST